MLQALVSGIVQGLTEFFPVSSSGHLVILHAFVRSRVPELAFDVALHVGTLVSIVIFLRRDICAMFTSDRKTLGAVIAACVPTFIIALAVKDRAEGLFSRPGAVGCALIVTALWVALGSGALALYRHRGVERQIGLAQAVAIGIAQGIAVVPGVSRSGATIATALLVGISGRRAFTFSFLVGLPTILGASVLEAKDITASALGGFAPDLIVGSLAAMCTGIAALKLLGGLVEQNRIYIFSVYCLVVGFATMLIFR